MNRKTSKNLLLSSFFSAALSIVTTQFVTPAALAHDYTPGRLVTPREQRVTEDLMVQSVIQATETRDQLQCKLRPVSWRCLNGPSCGYTLDFFCIPAIRSSGPEYGKEIQIIGFDNGSKNSIFEIKFKDIRTDTLPPWEGVN